MSREGEPPIQRLLQVMARLRDPERGCPWDLEQNFASIAPYTIEEAYEVADAIARGDLAELKDELGLDHFEGRGWRVFHHHGALCIAAYAFLAGDRAALSPPEPLAFLRPARLPKGFKPRGAPGAA